MTKLTFAGSLSFKRMPLPPRVSGTARYGNEVSGGGEYEAKLFAERLIEKYDVQIITTTAMDYMTWDNYTSGSP